MIQFFFITLGLAAAVFIAWFAVWLPLKIEKDGEIIKTPGSLTTTTTQKR
tara:strand:+ start:23 stop:172 length:150 start_codon:yes stop_codon:yes gene_type:complete